MLVAVEIGSDGLAREPEVLAAFPAHEGFEAPAMHATLSTRFRPAVFDGKAVDQREYVGFHFEVEGGSYLWDRERLAMVVQQANAGGASAQRVVGEVVKADKRALGVSRLQARTYMIGQGRAAGDPRAQYWVGQELAWIPQCGYEEQAARWLRAAADNNEPSAAVRLARTLVGDSPDGGAAAGGPGAIDCGSEIHVRVRGPPGHRRAGFIALRRR